MKYFLKKEGKLSSSSKKKLEALISIRDSIKDCKVNNNFKKNFVPEIDEYFEGRFFLALTL
ncbi:MAG: hypothetical protein LBT82_03045 [Oscillospiraceae bacterium]|jgi:hypothetical protein|nr:hypothetical protein [Oscillospiraceae bacterium]